MTLSSANVDMSPKFESFAAIFLKILLIIFPDLVLGRLGANWRTSGVANPPIFPRTVYKIKNSNLIGCGKYFGIKY